MNASSLLQAALILGGVGLLFGALIAIVHRKMKVEEDPRIDAVEQLLPGVNCGACGTPGCRAFAEALIHGAKQPAGCTVMDSESIADVAEYLGVDVGKSNKRVARLLCAGGSHVAPSLASYRGFSSCKAAAAVSGGGKACSWGCLGLADCAEACDFDAITMNEFALPVVDPALCTACNDCVIACPKDLFVLMPIEQKLIVQCKSLLEGDAAVSLCSVACNGCGKCVVDAKPGLISMQSGLAVIDYTRNELAGIEATRRCPTGSIVWVEGKQFEKDTKEIRS